MNDTMTIRQRIQEGINLHRRDAQQGPDMVVLSESAHKKFLDEGVDEGGPYSLAPVDPVTVPAGEIGTVDGVPIRVLPDMPRDYVGVVVGV